jgi:hypothetical protein
LRGVCNDRDAELAARFEQRDLEVLDVEREGAVFDFDSSDGVDGVCAMEGTGGDFREAEVLYFFLP